MSLDTETTKLDFKKRKWAPQQMRNHKLPYVIRKSNYKVRARICPEGHNKFFNLHLKGQLLFPSFERPYFHHGLRIPYPSPLTTYLICLVHEYHLPTITLGRRQESDQCSRSQWIRSNRPIPGDSCWRSGCSQTYRIAIWHQHLTPQRYNNRLTS